MERADSDKADPLDRSTHNYLHHMNRRLAVRYDLDF